MRKVGFGCGRRQWIGQVAFLLAVLLVAGCGGGKSKVSGRVLFKGAPLPGGQVTFRPVDPKHNVVLAELDAQGNYEAVLPVGPVKVSVDNRGLEPQGASADGLPVDLPFSPEAKKVFKGKPESAAPVPSAPDTDARAKPGARYIPIPKRYYDVDKSGLDFKVESGDMKHDIELSP